MFKLSLSLLLITLNLHAESITLQTLLLSATENSNRLKIYQTDEKIEQSKVEMIYGQYYPNLALSYNTEYNRDLNGVPVGTESVGDTVITNGTRYQSSLALNLNYELYHFGTTEKGINIAKSEVDIKHLLWCEEEKKLHQSILDRYNSALKMKIKSDIRKEMLEIRRKLYEIKKRLYRAGNYSKVDLGDEAIYIIDIEREVELALLQYQEDIIQLSSLSYKELDDKKTNLLPIGFSTIDVLADNFEETTEGYKYIKQIGQKQEEISQYLRSQYPTVSMYGNYYLYGSDPSAVYDSFQDISKNSWKVGIAVRLSIFEGFKYNNESERLRLELQRIKEEQKMRKREYEYDAKAKTSKIIQLVALQEKDEALYENSQEKIEMINRLRKNYQVDSVSELNALLEGLERELNLKIEQTEAAYENASLDILYRGVEQCTQH